MLKKEKGAALRLPAASRETTQAMGRGIMTDARSLYTSGFGMALRSK
jgi:hypothetical protein